MITTEEARKRIEAQLLVARSECKRAKNPVDKIRINKRIDRLLDEYLQLGDRSALEVGS